MKSISGEAFSVAADEHKANRDILIKETNLNVILWSLSSDDRAQKWTFLEYLRNQTAKIVFW